MQATRPQADRVYVVIRDPESGRSKTLTLYNIDVDRAFQWLTDRVAEFSEDEKSSKK